MAIIPLGKIVIGPQPTTPQPLNVNLTIPSTNYRRVVLCTPFNLSSNIYLLPVGNSIVANPSEILLTIGPNQHIEFPGACGSVVRLEDYVIDSEGNAFVTGFAITD